MAFSLPPPTSFGASMANMGIAEERVCALVGRICCQLEGPFVDNLPPWTQKRSEAIVKARGTVERGDGLARTIKGEEPGDAKTKEELQPRLMKHRYIRGPLRFMVGLDLAKRSVKPEARDMLKLALKDLIPEVPEDWKMNQYGHIRLAALCNDTGLNLNQLSTRNGYCGTAPISTK